MADESTDVSTIEELAICFCWVKNGEAEEHFVDILLLQKADAQSITATIVECCTKNQIQMGKLVGMGFDGAPFLVVKVEEVVHTCTFHSLPLPSPSDGFGTGYK